MVSYYCESATVELSKDSTVKAVATVMVAQAAKIDPSRRCQSRSAQEQLWT
jgi:hypothetical protein